MVEQWEEEGLVNSQLDHRYPKWGWPDCSESGLFQKHWIQLLPSGIFMCLALKTSTNPHSCRAGTILHFSVTYWELEAQSQALSSEIFVQHWAQGAPGALAEEKAKEQRPSLREGQQKGFSPHPRKMIRLCQRGKKYIYIIVSNCKITEVDSWAHCNEFLAKWFYLLIWTTQNEGRILVTQKLHQKEKPDVLWIPPLMSYKCWVFFHCTRKWWIFKHTQNKLFVITLDLQKKEGT